MEDVMVYKLKKEETGILSILKCGELYRTFEPNEKEEAQKEMKKLVKSHQDKLSIWLREGWQVSKKGNEYKEWEGFHLVVFKKNDKWAGILTDNINKRCKYAKRDYTTSEEVKKAAFDFATCW